MRVNADRNKCCGAGSCALTAPQVFEQDPEDGLVVVIDPRPPQALHESVRDAVELCPNAVITIEQMEASST